VVQIDVADLRRRWPDEVTFEQQSPPERYHLTWEEFSMTRKYHVVIVIPISRRRLFHRKPLGFVTIELFKDGHAADLFRLYEKDMAFDAVLGVCKDALRTP
jgi:hypothetical protein